MVSIPRGRRMSFGTRVCCVALFVFVILGIALGASKKQAAISSIGDCFRSDLKGKRCTPTRLQSDGNALLSLYKSGTGGYYRR